MKIFSNASFAIRIIYAICLAGASYNHARQILEHGLMWDYGGLPLFVCAFWTSLTFIDPLAVALLLATRRVGLTLTVAIIVSDVLVNTWVGMSHDFLGEMSNMLGLIQNGAYISQVAFLIFVGLTVRLAWRAKPQRDMFDGMTLEFPPIGKGR